ncbi:MAG: AraC family transcriptional regulator [Treponema sp.]|jgi:AraC-like DNA-binding protein|nr:AraC family transcriptional regulator [Treponema sp.]
MKNNSEKTWNSFLHYLPYSKEDEKLGMVCTTAGSMEVPPCSAYPPGKDDHPVIFRSVAEGRSLPGFHIIYITGGRGYFEAEGKHWDVEPGSVLFLMPGMKHRYMPVFETGWHEYWVGFKGTFFNKLVKGNILSRDCVFFDTGIHNHMIEAYHLIFKEVISQKPLYQLRACSGIISLIAEILTMERRKSQPNYYESIIEKAKYLMESNIYGAINLPSIAGQLGISTSWLNEIFKNHTSMTPYQYYIHIKIHKAEDILAEEDISVKEAAWRMGFEDQYYFSRLFKSKTGVSPSGWKEYIG